MLFQDLMSSTICKQKKQRSRKYLLHYFNANAVCLQLSLVSDSASENFWLSP